ncbi:MAG: Asp23/Gls24 family envelope stress response protein [Clostridia bacterium]|nr:Asp23/Gls24 family envelope stress response protein [Clostridia bacterium]
MEEEKVVEVKAEDVKVENEGQEVVSENDIKGINISEEVVATIAGIAAQEVKGVASMNASGIGEMFGRKPKGVKVQVGEKDTVIDISLTIEYGARIPDIAWEVQNKVKTQVESMTGLNVVSVNVHVQGVNMPKKKGEQKAIDDKVETTVEEVKDKKEE